MTVKTTKEKERKVNHGINKHINDKIKCKTNN